MNSKQETRQTPSLKETLPDLSLQYSVKKYLGSGRNDSGYLVTDQDGQEFVALTPSLPYTRTKLAFNC